MRAQADPTRSVERRESGAAQHGGRGGAGNVFKDKPSDADAAKKAQDGSAVADDEHNKKPHEKNLVDKVKEKVLGKK
jgi:hypothetical protein